MDRYVMRVPRSDSGHRMNEQQFLPHQQQPGRIVMDSPYYDARCNPSAAPAMPAYPYPSPPQRFVQQFPGFAPQSPYLTDNPGVQQTYIHSGIDPGYLAGYTSNSSPMFPGQIIPVKGPELAPPASNPRPFVDTRYAPGTSTMPWMGADYRNDELAKPEKASANFKKTASNMIIKKDNEIDAKGQIIPVKGPELAPPASNPRPCVDTRYAPGTPTMPWLGADYRNDELAKPEKASANFKKTASNMIIKKDNEVDAKAAPGPFKSRAESGKDDSKTLSRADKQKALYRSGIRVFSGTVENVLKWHKALRDIGIVCFYEIVARCVSVRQSGGGGCAKQLIVRDDGGPAMQLIYYETDFLLPSLPANCTLRVVGKMVVGGSQLQAYWVRAATGDDVAALPRRAAVAAYHVAKLAQAYGQP